LRRNNDSTYENKVDALDVLFVNPSLDWKLDKQTKISQRVQNDIPNQETPHIGIAYLLASAKKQGITAKYFDMVADELSVLQLVELVNKTKPSLIGFTAFSVQANVAGAIAESLKHEVSGLVICVGGCHASALPQRTLEEFPAFDFVVCGEGEKILSRIIEADGDPALLSKIQGVVTRGKTDVSWNPVSDVDSLPFPAWEEFNLDKYPGTYPHRTKRELPMVAGRGCPYRCVFCCRALGDVPRLRSVLSVVAEIEYNIERFGCESIAFLDETFMLKKEWAKEFFETLIRRGINRKITWSCSTRVSQTSPELFQRMKEAGCYYIFFGLESANNETLKTIKKNITVEDIYNAVKWSKQAGIIPVGAFIIGLPGDTEDHVRQAIDLGKKLNLYSITFPIAVPFPGTDLRKWAEKNQYGMKILSDNWARYGKQGPGVMESVDLSWNRRKELQQIAYSYFPKQNMDEYLVHQRKLGYGF